MVTSSSNGPASLLQQPNGHGGRSATCQAARGGSSACPRYAAANLLAGTHDAAGAGGDRGLRPRGAELSGGPERDQSPARGAAPGSVVVVIVVIPGTNTEHLRGRPERQRGLGLLGVGGTTGRGRAAPDGASGAAAHPQRPRAARGELQEAAGAAERAARAGRGGSRHERHTEILLRARDFRCLTV